MVPLYDSGMGASSRGAMPQGFVAKDDVCDAHRCAEVYLQAQPCSRNDCGGSIARDVASRWWNLDEHDFQASIRNVPANLQGNGAVVLGIVDVAKVPSMGSAFHDMQPSLFHRHLSMYLCPFLVLRDRKTERDTVILMH